MKRYKGNLTAGGIKKVGEIVADWFDEGLRIIIMRSTVSFCAYIGIPESHPLAGFDYDDIPVEAHGGLTFADKGGKAWPKGYYWYGWDYAHAGDICRYKGMKLKDFGKADKDWTIKEIRDDSWNTIYDFKRLMKLAERIKNKSYEDSVTPKELRKMGLPIMAECMKKIQSFNLKQKKLK